MVPLKQIAHDVFERRILDGEIDDTARQELTDRRLQLARSHVETALPESDRPRVFTKCGLVWEEGETTVRNVLARESIRRECETSLRRLKVEYDVFFGGGSKKPPTDTEWRVQTLIKKYSDAQQLDPYLMSALIAQESTFTADVRSSANAVGLMQLIPSTARQYASSPALPTRSPRCRRCSRSGAWSAACCIPRTPSTRP